MLTVTAVRECVPVRVGYSDQPDGRREGRRDGRSTSIVRCASRPASLARPLVGAILAAVPLMVASSAWAAETWTAGSSITLTETYVVEDALTIEPGVHVTCAAGASLVVNGGATLLVEGTAEDPVWFGAIDAAVAWGGIWFFAGSQGTVRHLTVVEANSVSIAIQDASPLVEFCRVGHTTGSDGSPLRAGIIVEGSKAAPVIRHCIVESLHGHSRAPAASGTDGPNGSAGANGTFLNKNGGAGGAGQPGTPGLNGGQGGAAIGIWVQFGAGATIESNVIRGILGGHGGAGGAGGDGGDGGPGGDGIDSAFPGNGGDGGAGALPAVGGSGGGGGSALGIFLDGHGPNVVLAGNAIYAIAGGRGGNAGAGGEGGSGGEGGEGGACGFCPLAGAGGDGGAGTAGAAAGTAGFGGVTRAIGIQFQNSAGVLPVVNNTIALIVPPAAALGASGGAGGAGGLGGLGGLSGLAGDDGPPGVNGTSGGPGASSPSGSVTTAIGISAFGPGTSIEAHNNATALAPPSGASVAQFRAGSGAVMNVSHTCYSGAAVLTIGAVTLGPATIAADPGFVTPPTLLTCAEPCDPFAAVDLSLVASSPAIDLGDNSRVPGDLLTDIAGGPRITDGDGNGSSIVDAGAAESAALACGPDLTCDGTVNGADLAVLLGAWGACSAPCAADLDGSGAVDGADLALFLGSWG